MPPELQELSDAIARAQAAAAKLQRAAVQPEMPWQVSRKVSMLQHALYTLHFALLVVADSWPKR